MDAAQTIVFFVIAWWMVFFISLPFGIDRDQNPEPGMDPGAPERPRIGLKAAVTTGVTTLLTLAIYWAGEWGWLPLRDWLSFG